MNSTDHRYRNNILILFGKAFLGGLEFYIPIYALYLLEIAVTVYLVSILLAVYSIAILVFEVPTGALGDIIGRKKSMILSGVSSLIALVLYITANNFVDLVFAIAIAGLGYTFASGTSTALLYESVISITQNPPSFKKMTAIYSSLWPIGASISSIAGAYLGKMDLVYPFYATLVVGIPSFLLTFFIFEERNDGHDKPVPLRQSIDTIRKSRQLQIIILVGFFSYSLGEVIHKLKPVYFEYKQIEIELFGLLFFLTFGLSFLGSFLSTPLTNRFGNKKILIFSSFIPVLFQVLSVMTNGLLSGVLVTIGSLSWGVRWPIISHLANMELASKNRATILSIINVINFIGFSISSPIMGYLTDIYGINNLYLFEALTGFGLTFIYFKLEDRS